MTTDTSTPPPLGGGTSVADATGRFVRSPGFKFFTLGVLCLLLLIPASLVWLLVSEREDRARDVANDIAQTWGGTQRITGPFIVVPYEFEETRIVDDEETTITLRREAVFLPQALDITADATTQMRSRGIFDVTVYSADITLTGNFTTPSATAITQDPTRFLWNQARLSLAVSSTRSVRNAVNLDMDGQLRPFEPSLGITRSGPISTSSSERSHISDMAGMHVPMLFERGPRGFDFTIQLALNGSDSLYFSPAARETTASLTSPWPHPSFTGATLPQASDISETGEGFSAQWSVPHLSRAAPLAFELLGNSYLQQLRNGSFGVHFFQPVDYYASVDRALKYAILFIGIVFLSAFVIEVRTNKRVHVVQYVFVGLALVLFYVLLLSLSEHLGFLRAYLIAGSATALLIGAYCARSLESRASGGLVMGLTASVFGVLYLFLRLEDYALLAGSIFAFGVLATTMFATQKIDWSGNNPKTAELEPGAVAGGNRKVPEESMNDRSNTKS